MFSAGILPGRWRIYWQIEVMSNFYNVLFRGFSVNHMLDFPCAIDYKHRFRFTAKGESGNQRVKLLSRWPILGRYCEKIFV